MASEVTQAHVAAKRSQPSLGLTGKAVRAASPRPGLANGPAARWGSRFPALQAACYCSGSPSPLGVRDCGSPRCAAGPHTSSVVAAGQVEEETGLTQLTEGCWATLKEAEVLVS
ncbi:hypothetical protein U0070_020069 [Myodes glareolus]|uniref:Uncharacterized protein n=1 Tax=Myodes glareolus TaxID=447135 RepID=A0AAW0HJ42_MYOGA